MHILTSYLFLATAVVAQKSGIPAFDVSNQELLEMSRKLRAVDDNKASRSQIQLNYQQHTSTRDETDNANQKLFTRVDTSLLRKPTYELYIKMMDNFNRYAGTLEPRVTEKEERKEVGDFLTEVLKTKPFVELFQFFKRKGHPIATNANTYRFWIGQLWFSHYSRAYGKADTSGFEHVFIGEVKNGEISGLHNWIRVYMLERNASAQFDYKGFVVKRFKINVLIRMLYFPHLARVYRAIVQPKNETSLGRTLERELLLTFPMFCPKKFHFWAGLWPDEHVPSEGSTNIMAAVKFSWEKEQKRSGSILIGTSPEFDMALYTMCFLSRRGRDTCDVELDGCPLSITSYDIRQNNQVFIGSIFPSAGRLTDECRRQNR